MAESHNDRCFFPLTSLQIGDLQSYLSHLYLFTAVDSGKVFFLVDNRPWLEDLASRPTHLWQLMVTKSRLSPFANTRGRKTKKMMAELEESQTSSSSNINKFRIFKRWFNLIDAMKLSRKRAMLPVKEFRNSLIANSKLHRTLFGFIAFEVEWGHVRGISYLNELQTDTSLAIETKVMRRWEFDSTVHAVRSMSSWFPGTSGEQILLEHHLNDTIGEVFFDAEEYFPGTFETDMDWGTAGDSSPAFLSSSFCSYPASSETLSRRQLDHSPACGSNKRRKLMMSVRSFVQLGFSTEEVSEAERTFHEAHDPSDDEEPNEPTVYRDILILFRFDDHDLPFKLKDIVISNLRLLTLLEAGLPSWVIFLQSYPVFCRVYRPWMCPLARFLYVLISVVTVLIGFYDLYKNVPLLKATASRLFGPFFDWIDAIEMISRIKYLGTMLFLHNFQKAIKWLLTVTRSIQSVVSFVAKPMIRPVIELLELFLPVWSFFSQVLGSFFSITWMVIESSFVLVGDLIEILLLPFWYILVLVWNLGTFTATSFLFPLFWILKEILHAPFRLLQRIFNLAISFCTFIYWMIRDLWRFASSFFNFTREVETAVVSYEVSVWRSLWNDLFSTVFRALRSILNGVVAFFMACNRHRLSIYNHMKKLNQRCLRAAPGKTEAPLSLGGGIGASSSLGDVNTY